MHVWFAGALLAPVLGFAILGSSGCHRAPAPPVEANAAGEPTMSGPAVAPIDEKGLSRTDILLQLARLSHAEVTARLGPHRFESHTHYTVTPIASKDAPPPPPDVTPGFREGAPIHPFEGAAAYELTPTSLDETRFIVADAAGGLQLSNQNDHGYGFDAIFARDDLYLRMRYAPYIRHRPEGDEVERLRALAYEPGAALLEAVAPFVYLSTPSETMRLGRPAWQVSFSKQTAGKHQPPPGLGPGKTWRGALDVESLDGYAIVDRQRGTLLELRLQVRFSAPRGKAPPGAGAPAPENELVQVAAQHELTAVALGKDVVNIQPPSEWSEPPTRSRPTLEKQELLNGLVPGRP